MNTNLLIIGGILLLAGLALRYFGPGKITRFYGYRTRRSISSIGAWHSGNKFASKILVMEGTVVLIIACICSIINKPIEVPLIIIIFLPVGALILLIVLTQNHLKRHFNSDGTAK